MSRRRPTARYGSEARETVFRLEGDGKVRFRYRRSASRNEFLQVGHARAGGRAPDVGGGHGLPCGSLYRRGFAATRVARRFRIYEGARRLLRCRNGLVRPSARLADRSALDTLYDRSRPGPFGRYQGADGSGRPGDRADACLQLFLLVDPQQRMRAIGQSAALRRRSVYDRLRRSGDEGFRSEGQAAFAVQSAQPRGPGVDPGRVAPPRRDMPPSRRARRGGPKFTAS